MNFTSVNNKISFQPVIKWSGSKRRIVNEILEKAPHNFALYYEPFLGGGSLLYAIEAKRKYGSDINEPLINLWNLIKHNPEKVYKHYEKHWYMLNNDDNKDAYQVYYSIRERFNKFKKPEDLFFLTRTCVNGLIRYNKEGAFNNSFHYTRKGINPERLKAIILDWSIKIQNTIFECYDYRSLLDSVKKDDFVYLDPPYWNTKGRYHGKIDYDIFLTFLDSLNKIGTRYILSFDGTAGTRNYIFDLPKSLYKSHYFIINSNSTFNKVIDKKNIIVKESIYLNY